MICICLDAVSVVNNDTFTTAPFGSYWLLSVSHATSAAMASREIAVAGKRCSKFQSERRWR
eukprot:SAG31_NODE_3031_length_4765_cov_2.047364_2_plen_61_part_00